MMETDNREISISENQIIGVLGGQVTGSRTEEVCQAGDLPACSVFDDSVHQPRHLGGDGCERLCP